MAVPKQIEEAFAELRSLGFEAQGEFKCCPGCAVLHFQCEGVENHVSYQEEDAVTLRNTSQVFLTWEGDSATIIDVLSKHGLRPVWDGDPEHRILVTWTRRH